MSRELRKSLNSQTSDVAKRSKLEKWSALNIGNHCKFWSHTPNILTKAKLKGTLMQIWKLLYMFGLM